MLRVSFKVEFRTRVELKWKYRPSY